jgi:hypothetical protein
VCVVILGAVFCGPPVFAKGWDAHVAVQRLRNDCRQEAAGVPLLSCLLRLLVPGVSCTQPLLNAWLLQECVAVAQVCGDGDATPLHQPRPQHLGQSRCRLIAIGCRRSFLLLLLLLVVVSLSHCCCRRCCLGLPACGFILACHRLHGLM